MLVNPDLLRSFASQVDHATSDLAASDASFRSASNAADGVGGSETQWAMRQVGQHLWLSADKIVSEVGAIGVAVRGAGERYQVDDGALAVDFKKLF